MLFCRLGQKGRLTTLPKVYISFCDRRIVRLIYFQLFRVNQQFYHVYKILQYPVPTYTHSSLQCGLPKARSNDAYLKT